MAVQNEARIQIAGVRAQRDVVITILGAGVGIIFVSFLIALVIGYYYYPLSSRAAAFVTLGALLVCASTLTAIARRAFYTPEILAGSMGLGFFLKGDGIAASALLGLGAAGAAYGGISIASAPEEPFHEAHYSGFLIIPTAIEVAEFEHDVAKGTRPLDEAGWRLHLGSLLALGRPLCQGDACGKIDTAPELPVAEAPAPQSEQSSAATEPKCRSGEKFVRGGHEHAFWRPTDQRTPYFVRDMCADKNVVTVSAYSRCVQRRKCAEPDSLASACSRGKSSTGSDPVTCIGMEQAADFCLYRGMRLPTEREWVRVMRGIIKSEDLWEWTSDLILRRGTGTGPARSDRYSDRLTKAPAFPYDRIGFRCVRDATP